MISGAALPESASTSTRKSSTVMLPSRSMWERISTGRKSSGVESSPGRASVGKDLVLYNKADIKADGKVIVKADTLLQEMTSDNNGLAVCTIYSLK